VIGLASVLVLGLIAQREQNENDLTTPTVTFISTVGTGEGAGHPLARKF
jgi:hypothetical protein